MTKFYDEVVTFLSGHNIAHSTAQITAIQDLIQTYSKNVKTISDLQSRSLTSADEEVLRRTASELDTISTQTQNGSSEIKRRIQALEAARGKVSGRDYEAWVQQTNVVKSRFVAAIQEYQQTEQQYRQKSRQRMERQIRIVKPDATQEEIEAMVTSDGDAQVFSQALSSSQLLGESRAAYREVQQRHHEVKKIEKTMTELAQLFSDMSVVVAQQGDTLDAIEKNAAKVETDIEYGANDVEDAVSIARRVRRKRWIIFWIVVAILVVLAIILAATLSQLLPKNN
ncbi:syntaxin protein [Ceratobasidium sp. AG-Ba]|nr:syntaxin protein [Ceratobasidium sp. AG-Ba]